MFPVCFQLGKGRASPLTISRSFTGWRRGTYSLFEICLNSLFLLDTCIQEVVLSVYRETEENGVVYEEQSGKVISLRVSGDWENLLRSWVRSGIQTSLIL